MRIAACVGVVGLLACATSGQAPEGGLRDVTESMTTDNNTRGKQYIIFTNADVGAQSVVRAPLDSAYAAISGAYKVLGLDVKTADPMAHTVGNKKIVAMRTLLGKRLSAYLDCGLDPALGVPRADEYRVTISMVSSLAAKDPTNTIVTTLVTAEANDLATSASSVYCSSTGTLERMLLRSAGYQPS
jgi:hypothetical protein